MVTKGLACGGSTCKLVAAMWNSHGFPGGLWMSADGKTGTSLGGSKSKHPLRSAGKLAMAAPDAKSDGIDRSRDGGATWDTVKVPCADCSVTDVQPLSDTVAIATTLDLPSSGRRGCGG